MNDKKIMEVNGKKVVGIKEKDIKDVIEEGGKIIKVNVVK
jgi:hypothetical protein